jgi:DNA-binding CsgD family transcriptional regulator
VLAASPGGLTELFEYLQYVYLREPWPEITPPRQLRAGIGALVLHQDPARSWGLPRPVVERLSSPSPRDYRDYFAAADPPVPGGILRAGVAAGGRWVGALEMVRRDGARPFSRGDVAFMRLVAPLVGRALRAALDRERATMEPGDGDDASGVLLLGPGGRVRFHTPAAERWVRALRAAEGGGASHLPTAVWSALAGLRAGVEASGQASVRAQTPAGPLRVEASAGDDAETVAVVLTPERAPAPPELPAAWPLTRQERQVAELLVRGMSNRQLAAALHVSENTIQTHLAHAYAKLGVRGRGELVARFFQEVCWPALRPPADDAGRGSVERGA